MDAIAVSAQLGLFAVWLLTLNVLLGLLLSVRYNPLKRWPYRRMNYFTIHNWTGYVALALSAAHALVVPLSVAAGWVWSDMLWPSRVAQQPIGNVLGALALYLLAVVVATSWARRRLGRRSWKTIHYASYACAALFFLHGLLLDPKLANRPVDWFDAEKLSIEICIVAVILATVLRVRRAMRRRGAGPQSVDIASWAAPMPAEWVET